MFMAVFVIILPAFASSTLLHYFSILMSLLEGTFALAHKNEQNCEPLINKIMLHSIRSGQKLHRVPFRLGPVSTYFLFVCLFVFE